MRLKIGKHAFLVALGVVPSLALAHDGHGNSPLHALIHMIEANGFWLGLLFVAAIGSLAWQAHRTHRANAKEAVKRERGNDSR